MTDSSLLPSAAQRSPLPAPSVSGRTAPAAPRPYLDPARALVLGLDAWLRRRGRLIEFSERPDCMLRVAAIRAETEIRLSDGVVVARGDPILELHFWNERLPQASAYAGLGWGGRFGRGLMRSFGYLAEAIDADPRIAQAVAIRGRLAFAGARNRDETRRFGHWFGLETAAEEGPLTLGRRLHDAAEDVWLLALAYAFNPGCLAARQVVRRRDDLWMSKAALKARYAGARRAA